MATLCALAVGCAAPGAGDAGQAPAAPVPGAALPSRAERLADALLMADRAERAQDATALALAAQRLEQLGPKPQTEQDDAAMQRWMARLPGDARPMRGRALGPAYRSAALNPGATTQLNQTFLGGRSAQIVLKVSRGPAPQLVVRDQSDRQVCKTSDDPIKCLWVPLYTQRHSIEIVNIGPAISEFYIVFD
ncbi:MAG: hypothetical protein GW858_12900 [Sphingomonadales bacterium]|nr:hypothetical protein [Sphingomonadales bacterium]NCQ21918.1 hypothetical protein [Sphingomonadales bacterium]NCT04552.1 hypothetical protein [Sphingomonadales bacterium]